MEQNKPRWADSLWDCLMEAEASLPCSQESPTGDYAESQCNHLRTSRISLSLMRSVFSAWAAERFVAKDFTPKMIPVRALTHTA
jgi:hypothetical protein